MIRTKIIATLGPASDDEAVIRRLLHAGVDVFRLNFSHGSLEEHAARYERIRKICQDLDTHIAVMADLCGPKVRVDPVENGGVNIAEGDRLDIVGGTVLGNAERISTNRPGIVDEVKKGHRVLIDDGSIALRVAEVLPGRLRCVCEVGGTIRTRKGVNLPDSDLVVSALTDDDRRHAAWACEHGVEYVAISFVRKASDVDELRGLLPDPNRGPHVVSKIETPQALNDIDAIIRRSDAVLVARGDLGVELDLARVPLVQKDITRRCQAAAKPVIIATQMLQSMVNEPYATRAEVSDVANAVFDAADAVMLSAETSVGRYPVESVTTMNRIAAEAESYVVRRAETFTADSVATQYPETEAMARAADVLARQAEAVLVAAWTRFGHTVRLLSKCRLNRPVVGITADKSVCGRMSLYYGVFPLTIPRPARVRDMLHELDRTLLARKLCKSGDCVVVIAGRGVEELGSTDNALLVHTVEGG